MARAIAYDCPGRRPASMIVVGGDLIGVKDAA
jgi:hypothetical protein